MKSLNEYINEDVQINEGAGTVALGIVGGLICYKAFVSIATVFLKKLGNKVSIKKFTEIRNRMSEILAKHPEDLDKPMLRSIKDFESDPEDTNYAYMFTDDNDMLTIKLTQLGLTIKDWDEDDRKEFLKLYKQSADIWNAILKLNNVK